MNIDWARLDTSYTNHASPVRLLWGDIEKNILDLTWGVALWVVWSLWLPSKIYTISWVDKELVKKNIDALMEILAVDTVYFFEDTGINRVWLSDTPYGESNGYLDVRV